MAPYPQSLVNISNPSTTAKSKLPRALDGMKILGTDEAEDLKLEASTSDKQSRMTSDMVSNYKHFKTQIQVNVCSNVLTLSIFR